MPPRGGNAKKESGRAKKAENEAKKKESAAGEKVLVHAKLIVRLLLRHRYQQERLEASKWDQGVKKDKNADKEAKRQEQLARKAEAARLLAEEEASTSVKKNTSSKAGNKKKDTKPAGPGPLSDEGGPDSAPVEEAKEIESYSATGIDNALDLLEVVNAKTDKASVGQQAAGIERHPEVSVDVGVYAQLFRDSYLCLPALTAKVQGERIRPRTPAKCRAMCSCVSVH